MRDFHLGNTSQGCSFNCFALSKMSIYRGMEPKRKGKRHHPIGKSLAWWEVAGTRQQTYMFRQPGSVILMQLNETLTPQSWAAYPRRSRAKGCGVPACAHDTGLDNRSSPRRAHKSPGALASQSRGRVAGRQSRVRACTRDESRRVAAPPPPPPARVPGHWDWPAGPRRADTLALLAWCRQSRCTGIGTGTVCTVQQWRPCSLLGSRELGLSWQSRHSRHQGLASPGNRDTLAPGSPGTREAGCLGHSLYLLGHPGQSRDSALGNRDV